jgi:DNA repair protein RecO (recombination protein O)
MKIVRTQAIVLRRTNYGEADRILQLLTPTGKRSVIAHGVRREKSRLAAGVELFAICDVVINEGKGELGTLTSARLSQFYRHIIEDYDRMQFAYTAIKLTSGASETVDGSDWYDVLAETLAGLDNLLMELELIQTWFYIRYSALMGYELSLWHDVNGDKLLSDAKYHYDELEQGLRETSSGELTSNHIKLLRLIATRPLKPLAQIGGIELILPDCLLLARQHAAIKI